MKYKLKFVIVLSLLFYSWVWSAQKPSSVNVTSGKDGFIYLILTHHNLINDRAKKDLNSGLSTKAMILGQVLDSSGGVIFQNLNRISVKYDLWEEKFYLTVYENKITTTHASDVVQAFEKPKPIRLAPIHLLKRGLIYRVRSIEAVNPLDQEKFDALQNWMINQKSVVRGLGGGSDSSSVLSVPETAFKTLFHSLWNRSKSGEALTGELRREILSEPFSVESLKAMEGPLQ